MSDDDYTPPKNHLPQYALFRGRRVKILYYREGEARPFRILDRYDDQWNVTRAQLTFLKDKKKEG